MRCTPFGCGTTCAPEISGGCPGESSFFYWRVLPWSWRLRLRPGRGWHGVAGDEREEQIASEDDEMKKNYENIERYKEYNQRLRDAALSFSKSKEVLGQMYSREWYIGGFDANPYSPGLGFPNIEFPSEDNIPLFTNDIINTDKINKYIITPSDYASDKIEALDKTEPLYKTKTALPGKLKLIQYALGAYDIYNAEDPTKEFAGIAISTLAGFIPLIGPELSLLLALTGWDEKIGGYLVDYYRDPPSLYDPGAIMGPEFAGFTHNFLQSHTSVKMEELLNEEFLYSLSPNMEESLQPYVPLLRRRWAMNRLFVLLPLIWKNY